jgi:hypothetical protein
MQDKIQDLWPDDIQVNDVLSPHIIVQEQGNLLGKKTNNIVIGKVKMNTYYDKFQYRFFLYSSPIDYQYQLFEFEYNPNLYPVKIRADEEIMKQFYPDEENKREILVNSEAELVEVLKAIFAAPKTRKIITAILAQAKN